MIDGLIFFNPEFLLEIFRNKSMAVFGDKNITMVFQRVQQCWSNALRETVMLAESQMVLSAFMHVKQSSTQSNGPAVCGSSIRSQPPVILHQSWKALSLQHVWTSHLLATWGRRLIVSDSRAPKHVQVCERYSVRPELSNSAYIKTCHCDALTFLNR